MSFHYDDADAHCPIKNLLEDCFQGVKSREQEEVVSILQLLALAVPVSERPPTARYNCVESVMQIAAKQFGRTDALTEKIEAVVRPLEDFYKTIGSKVEL